MRAVLRRVRPGFRVLVGSVVILNQALRAGAAGAVLGQANFAPELCVGLYQAFLQRKRKTALEFQERLLPLARKIALPFGVPGVKAALDLSGYAGGFPRAPLAPLGPASRELVAALSVRPAPGSSTEGSRQLAVGSKRRKRRDRVSQRDSFREERRKRVFSLSLGERVARDRRISEVS